MDGCCGNDVFGVVFSVFDEYVKVAVFVKYARINEFVLRLELARLFVFVYEFLVGKFCLRILIQHLHVAVRGGGVQVVIDLLYIFAMIALVATQPKKSLLQKGVFSIPKAPSYAKMLSVV